MYTVFYVVFGIISIFLLFIYLASKPQVHYETFIDQPTSAQPVVPVVPVVPELKDDLDYQEFYKWHSSFCETWMKVIDQSMKVDQTSLSTKEYIQKLETSQNSKFIKCSPEITADPDPIALIPLIPDKPDLYLSTLNYMSQRISSIKETTERALRGERPTVPEEGFADVKGQTCSIPCPPDVIQARAMAITEVRERVKRFNPSIQTLKGQLQIVQSGLRDLETYKQRAESGELIKDINIQSE
jgi:hypothetical protein